MIQRNGKISHALGSEELTLLKWPCFPKQSTDLMQSPSKYSFLVTFENSRPVILCSIPQFGFVCSFLMIRFNSCIFGRSSTELTLSSACILSGGANDLSLWMVLWTFEFGGVYQLPIFGVYIFSFNEAFVRRNFKTVKYCLPP